MPATAKRGVADHLRLEALAVHPPEQAVLRIDFRFRFIRHRTIAGRRWTSRSAVDRLDAPAGSEFGGQPVEQRVTLGLVAHGAEIVGRPHHAMPMRNCQIRLTITRPSTGYRERPASWRRPCGAPWMPWESDTLLDHERNRGFHRFQAAMRISEAQYIALGRRLTRVDERIRRRQRIGCGRFHFVAAVPAICARSAFTAAGMAATTSSHAGLDLRLGVRRQAASVPASACPLGVRELPAAWDPAPLCAPRQLLLIGFRQRLERSLNRRQPLLVCLLGRLPCGFLVRRGDLHLLALGRGEDACKA